MTGEELVSHLAKVRKTGPGRWLACCPAHEDRSASLSIREMDDGRVLVHCFAECATVDVMHALGLAMWELFPKAADFHRPKERRPFAPIDVLRAVAQESLVAAHISSNIRQRMQLSDADHDRLWTAATRLQSAYEVAAGA
jgi:hypothetical protein